MEGEDRRYKLARLHEERTNYVPKRGLAGGLRRNQDRWRRFIASAGWEKLFVAGAVVLIAVLAIGALFVLTSNAGGGNKKQAAAGSKPTPTATRKVARGTPTTIVIGVPVLPTALPTDRLDCVALKNKDFKSDAERAFFETDCNTPTPEPTGTATQTNPGGGYTPPPPRPTDPPPTPDVFTAGDAISLGTYWMTHSGGYQSPSGCNAFDSGNHWVVTCNATGPSGPAVVSVCVYTDPLVVRPSSEC